MLGISEYKASVAALVAANVLPLLGVIFLGWDAFAVVVLYWCENVVIGGINVLKMITCSPDPAEVALPKLLGEGDAKELREQFDSPAARAAHHGSKLFFVPFFTFHYGLFCLVHGAFVFALFGHETVSFGLLGEVRNFIAVLAEQHLWWAAVALAASHLVSFFTNYLGRGEYRRTIVPVLMVQPYSRVVVLHVAILFGGIAAQALGSNIGVLALLIAGKTALDLKLHLWERARNAGDISRGATGAA